MRGTERIHVTEDREPIDSLTPHPDNARRGNIKVIADSLRTHGQYRPIVAQRSTRHIIAGNHTWAAAKRLQWADIAVSWLDCDDATARRVLIADNKTSDLASYDLDALITVLKQMPTLDGTGYDSHDLDNLVKSTAVTPTEGGTPTETDAPKPDIHLGRYDLWLTQTAAIALHNRLDQGDKRATVRHIRLTLGLPAPTPAKPPPQRHTTQTAAIVDLSTLTHYAHNPREGDIGAITQSLTAFGQYRPIVVNRRNMTILVGNHTAQAARMLGWKQIAATFVDVDEDAAARIVLIDNRTADLATYDDNRLLATLVAIDINGTGFTPDDLDLLMQDVATGRTHRKAATTSDVGCRISTWPFKVARADFDTWDAYADQYEMIANRLGLELDSWRTEA